MTTAQSAHASQANVTEEAVVIDAAREHAVALHALLVRGALRVRLARRHAAALEASAAGARALAVPLTCDRNSDALLARLASESRRTRTDGLVIVDPAFGVHAARSLDRARIHALAADARLRVVALGVRLTGRPADGVVAERVRRTVRLGLARDRHSDAPGDRVGGVALVALAALARRFVIGWNAVGVRSAGLSSAHVLALGLALLGPADGRRRAVLVLAALDGLLAALRVRLADRSGWTRALVRSSRVLAPGTGSARRLRAVVDRAARSPRIASVARLTFAHRCVSLGEAERVFTCL